MNNPSNDFEHRDTRSCIKRIDLMGRILQHPVTLFLQWCCCVLFFFTMTGLGQLIVSLFAN